MLTELQNERKKHHYSCQAMANKLGISKTYYWQLEQGKRRLVYSIALKIAQALECSTDKLFYDHYMEKLGLQEKVQYVNQTESI